MTDDTKATGLTAHTGVSHTLAPPRTASDGVADAGFKRCGTQRIFAQVFSENRRRFQPVSMVLPGGALGRWRHGRLAANVMTL